jgi:hypothetical protein
VWDETSGRCYLAEEVVQAEITFQELVALLRPLVATYRPMAVTVDSSGNRQGFESVKAGLLSEGLTGVAIEPRKVLSVGDQVGLVNQALKAGRLFVPATSRAASDFGLVTWHKGIPGVKLDPGYHSDAIPALTYAYQYAQPLLPEFRASAAVRTAAQQAVDRLIESRFEQVRREKEEARPLDGFEIEDDEPAYATG